MKHSPRIPALIRASAGDPLLHVLCLAAAVFLSVPGDEPKLESGPITPPATRRAATEPGPE